MKKWDAETINKCYENSIHNFEDGIQHAAKQGIPDFIEEYRVARVKDYIAEDIVAFSKEKSESHILDAGCGHGWFVFRLFDKWKFSGHITGVDISSHNISIFKKEIAKRKMENQISAKIANVESLPFDDKSFDIIYATESIEHFNSLDTFFAESARLLKDDGVLIITTPSGPMHKFWKTIFFIPSFFYRLFFKKRSIDEPKSVFEHTYSKQEIFNSVEKCHLFNCVKYQKNVMLPHESYIQFLPRFLQVLTWKFALIFERISFFKNRLGLHQIIYFKKINS